MKKLILTTLVLLFVACESPSYEYSKDLQFEVVDEGIKDLSEIENSMFIFSVQNIGESDFISIWNYNNWFIKRAVRVEEKLDHVLITTELQENTYPVPAYGNPVTYQTVSVQHTGKMYVLAN
jgi:hypothetical protein